MALNLDGSAHNNAVTASITATLTTANPGDVIAVVVTTNGGPVTGVSSANTTGWAKRASAAVGNTIELWYGVAAAALSSEVITATVTVSSFCTIDAFGISGADTVAIWDSNGALPNTVTTGDAAITTSNANDFLIGAYRFGGTASPTAGTGWTIISGANFQLVEYKIVSATQSALDVAIGTGSGDVNGGIGDAVIQATATRHFLGLLGVGS